MSAMIEFLDHFGECSYLIVILNASENISENPHFFGNGAFQIGLPFNQLGRHAFVGVVEQIDSMKF